MNAATDGPTDTVATSGTRRRQRRWHRVVIPYAVALLLFAVTGMAHAAEEPDFDEPGTLSPTGTGPDGSSRLAELLAQRGVTIERHLSSGSALRSAMRADATVLVPHPAYSNPNFVRLLAAVPANNRLVLVAPQPKDQYFMPVWLGGSRWASRATEPGCAEPAAEAAGRATVELRRYQDVGGDTEFSCYRGGLVATRWRGLELYVIGATDPFRNSRIGEHGNGALAAGLLSTKDRLIWLDLHAPERASLSTVESGSIQIDLPNLPDPDPERQPQADDSPLDPRLTSVPGLFWPVLVQLLVVAFVLALWRARRLGPPVPEPLPVVVPSVETVTGRGRLYGRAKARGPALDVLRAAALRRIVTAVDLPQDADPADVVAVAARHSGAHPAWLRDLLYGPEPGDDAGLLASAAALDALVLRLTHERRMPHEREAERDDRVDR